MYCYLLFLLLLDCWFCDIFLTFFDAGFWRTTNSRDPSLPRCPRFQISRPCKLPGAFLYPWLFTSFMIAGHIGWFFLFCLFHLPFVLYCAYQRNFLLWCFFVTYVALVMKCSFVPLEQGSSSEQTYRWHPEAHLLERSTAVPVRTLQHFVLRTVEYVSEGNISVLLILRGLRGNSLTGTLSPDMCQLTGLWYL